MYCDKCGAENRNEAAFCSQCGKEFGGAGKAPARGSGDYYSRFRTFVSNRYRIERELGRGGMAVVYLATDKRLGRKVALKLLPEALARDDNFTGRFMHEARVAAKLSHPNIVPIHDVYHDDGFTYYSMAFIDGIPLDRVIKKNKQLTPRMIERLGIQICFALQHAHEQGVVHRDIKPENILVTRKGMPIVVDFGIAKAMSGTRLSQTGMFIGTPQYMSPEQITTGEVDGRSDIYSLGCVLYEMAVGTPPFKGLDQTSLMYNHVHVAPPAPHEVNRSVPEYLSNVIMRAVAKDPADRFPDTAALGRDLHRLMSSKTAGDDVGGGHAGNAAVVAPAGDEKTAVPVASGIPDATAPEPDVPVDTVLTGNTGRAPESATTAEKDDSRRKRSIPVVPVILGAAGVTVAAAALMWMLGGAGLEPGQPAGMETAVQNIAPESQPANLVPKTQSESDPEPRTSPQTAESAMPETPVSPLSDGRRPASEPEPVAQLETAATSQQSRQTADETIPATSSANRPTETGSSAHDTAAADSPARALRQETAPEPAPLVAPDNTPADNAISREYIRWVVIPGGTFAMGDSQGDLPEQLSCRPVHRVTLTGFEISRDEVTVRQYTIFLEATGHEPPPEWELQMERPGRPVVFVSWNDAAAFAAWAEARLPTEAEWEYASRGGFDARKYPWGNDNPTGYANFGQEWNSGSGWISHLAEVGTYPPNRYGLHDMVGNVWEWCDDMFAEYSTASAINPVISRNGQGRVVRGGAWNSTAELIRNAIRGPQDPAYRGPHTGFRIARDTRR